MTTVREALEHARAAGLARLDAQLLLLHALGRSRDDRAWLIAHDGDALDAVTMLRYQALCGQRADAVPLAYLVGKRSFYGLELEVDARVLDPRPDTETLVDWALALPGMPDAARVVDLGTGSGAIALAIKAQRPHWQVCAVDASEAALQVARANALRLGLAIETVHGHWLQTIPAATRFDLIVSNPPYLRADDQHLPALRHEPREALVAGDDGLRDLREIAAGAAAHLQPGGWLLLEHGHDQADDVRTLLRTAGYAQVQSRKDLAGIERCTGGRHTGSAPL